MAVLAIDTISHLPITSKGNRWVLTAFLHTSYLFMIVMKEKLADNAIHVYLSGILAQKGNSATILSDNGTEFGNNVLNEAYNQLGIKNYSPTHSIHKAMQEMRRSIDF